MGAKKTAKKWSDKLFGWLNRCWGFGQAGAAAEVWLVGFAAKEYRGWRRLARRLWPASYPVGELPGGERVRQAELPWTAAEFWGMPRGRQREAALQLAKRLCQGGAGRIGVNLRLLNLLGEKRPPAVCDGREAAARAFVGLAARRFGDLQGVTVAMLGVERDWHRHLCQALLEAGARPVLYGARAVSLAEYYYERLGVAIPVFGARKTIRSSQVILLLDPGLAGAAKLGGGRVMLFEEVRVEVQGRFVGRFGFGVFPACQAAALDYDEAH